MLFPALARGMHSSSSQQVGIKVLFCSGAEHSAVGVSVGSSCCTGMAFSISLQMKPGSKPHSVRDRECSGFLSLTDQRVQGRSGAFVTRKGNVTIPMELPLSPVPVL